MGKIPVGARLSMFRPSFLNARFAGAVISKQANKCDKVCDLVDLGYSFSWHGFGFGITQIKKEISELLKVLARRRVQFMLEIGTASGGTLFFFSRVATPDALIISVDLPEGDFGGGYSEAYIPFYESFVLPKQNLNLIRADSHRQSTLDSVKHILDHDKLDFLFIDGDHTYEGVKKDFEMYGSLVKRGGLVAFHDICEHPSEIGCRVHDFWNEIKSLYNNQELVDNPLQNWAGIGLLYV